MDRCYADVVAVLQTYFDGLHHSDTGRLRQVFHPRAHYVTATAGAADGEAPLHLTMAEYFPIVDARPSPASRGERQRVVWGERLSVRVELGGGAILTKKKKNIHNYQ